MSHQSDGVDPVRQPGGNLAGPQEESANHQIKEISLQERLALLLDAAGAVGWWDWDIQRDLICAGRPLAELFGLDPEEAARGASLTSFLDGIDPRDRPRISEAIERAVEQRGSFAEEYRIAGTEVGFRPKWVFAGGKCYADENGTPVRFPGVLLDITQRKTTELRKQALLVLGDRLRDLPDMESVAYAAGETLAEVLSPGRAGFGIVDSENETVVVMPEWRLEGISSISGTHYFREYGSFIDDLKADRIVLIKDVEKDERTVAAAKALLEIDIRALINVPIVEHGKLVLVVFIHNNRPVDWSERDLPFIHAVADRVQAALAQLRAEEQRELLNRELSHRLKNSLAMVQSIVSQSMRTTSSLEEARNTIGKRLSTLGRAHEVLLNAVREEANITDVVSSALLPHDNGRIRVSGPFLRLSGSAALSLSLLIHELATNALKYGSLAVADGQVDLVWKIVPGDQDRIVMRWTESGGPPVEPPEGGGFGSRLIRHGFSGATDQSVNIEYRPEGLVCRIEAALDGIAA